jgi:hypothetical protein
MKQNAAGEANSCSAAQYFLHFFETQKFFVVFEILQLLAPVLHYMFSIYVFKDYFHVILSLRLGLPSDPSDFPTTNM